MAVRISSVDGDTLGDIFEGCRSCVYWERPERFRQSAAGEGANLKSEWFETTAAQFDPCGKLLYVDDEPAAYCQYAPPQYVPGVSRYDGLARRLDKDGVLITCLCVSEKHQRKGLGRRLLREVIEDMRRRKIKSLETFARDDSANNCSGPTRFYLAQGFSVIATETYPEGGSYSLVRMEIAQRDAGA